MTRCRLPKKKIGRALYFPASLIYNRRTYLSYSLVILESRDTQFVVPQIRRRK